MDYLLLFFLILLLIIVLIILINIRKNDEKNFYSTKELLIKYKCIEDTLVRANHFADVAVDSLSIFSDNEYKSALIKLIETSVKLSLIHI